MAPRRGGVPDGPAQQWWGDPPVLMWEGQWDRGRKQGEWMYATYSGKPFLLTEYEDDLPVGAPSPDCEEGRVPTSSHAWPGGKEVPSIDRISIWIECRDEDSTHPIYRSVWQTLLWSHEREGHFIDWNPIAERVLGEMIFEKGETLGTLESFHPNGQLRFRRTFVDGKLHGPAQNWYANGVLRARETIVDGRTQGLSSRSYPDGQLESLTRRAPGSDRPQLILRAAPDGRWLPDEEEGCLAQGGEWVTLEDLGWHTLGIPRCALAYLEDQAACAEAGECEAACRIDEDSASIVCP